MRVVPAVVAVLTLSAVNPAYLTGQTVGESLTIVDDAVRIVEGQLRFRLQNQATVPVTAWRVAADYLLADGTSQRIVYGREGYLAISGLGPPEHAAGRVVSAEAQTDVAILLPEAWPAVTSVRLRVESAVFADGSAFGPPAEIEAIFARRTEDRVAWERIRAAFERARSAGTEDGVTSAIEELDFPGDASYRHHLVTAARKDLERLISSRQGRSQQRSLGAILSDWVRRADAHIAAATKHSQRR